MKHDERNINHDRSFACDHWESGAVCDPVREQAVLYCFVLFWERARVHASTISCKQTSSTNATLRSGVDVIFR